MSDTGALAERNVSSTGGGSSSTTVVPVALEQRQIVFAQGAEFTNAQLRAGKRTGNMVPVWVKAKLPAIEVAGDDTITYTSEKQRVRFTVKFVSDKLAFKKALETPGVHVVYSGHARYGRGPCFGPEAKGETWGIGTGSGKDGIWGTGYPLIPVEESDIIHHGYTCPVVLANGAKPAKPPLEDCHPDIKANYGNLHPYGRSGTYKLDPKIVDHLEPAVGTDDKVWAFKDGKDVNLVTRAGWNDSVFTQPDLGATDMKCKVFCHFGCSSLRHNQKIIRQEKYKGWTKEADDHYAYFTTASTYDDIEPNWIYHLFNYSTMNAFKPWGPSLKYAVDKTNQYLINHGRDYQLR